MTETTTASPTAERALLDPPGGMLLWIIVALELLAFVLVFALVAWLRAEAPQVFREQQSALDPTIGGALTIALVTSGWLVAEGVHAFRANRTAQARRHFGLGIASGLGFVGLKLYDYAAKVGAGHGLGESDFWDAYFLGTGFHFAHVLVGLILLAFAAHRIGRAPMEDPETSVAGVALFWHMCDLAWFFLFPLFYARS